MGERQDKVEAVLLRVAAASHAHGFGWLVLGGLPQAKLLHPEGGRDPGAIDLLVPRGQTEAVARALRAEGFTQAAHALAAAAALARAGLRSDARLTLIDPATGERVHLHERLFFVSPGMKGLDGYQPRRSRDARDIPAPPVAPAMALDILLRGNARRWVKPCWRADLSAVLARLDAGQCATLIAEIERAGFAPGAAASLLALPAIPPAIEPWLAKWRGVPEIAVRMAMHGEAIARPKLAAPSIAARLLARLARIIPRAGRFTAEPATRLDRYPLAFRFAQQRLGAEGEHRILSFGCSSGEEVATLRRYFPNAIIKGVDIDPRAIAAARLRIDDPRVRFEQAGTAAAEADAAYDAIFCMAVFRDPALDRPETERATGTMHFAAFEGGIRELVRALKPGGLIFVEHANFRLADTASASAVEVVLHSDPRGSGLEPGLYGPDDLRMHGAVDRTLGFEKRG